MWAKIIIVFIVMLNMGNVVSNTNIDPFEDINRMVFEFNEVIDNNLLEPTTLIYTENVPEIMQSGVSNFFRNLRDVNTLANQILQLKVDGSINTLIRIILNTTFGVAGVVDVAASTGINSVNEDFGQTLAGWGVPSGPYIVLPLLGPATLRGSIGAYADIYSNANMINRIFIDNGFNVSVEALNVLDKRAMMMPITKMFDNSMDPYMTMRSSYLQNREYEIMDGNLPMEEEF